MSEVIRIHDVLPKNYGYVVLVAGESVIYNMWLIRNVKKARTKFGIEYPTMYSLDINEFNCIQRAHQNFLEYYPTFLFTLFIGGLQLPRLTAAAGGFFLLFRIAYAKGYYTGNPEKKSFGGRIAAIGLLVMLGNTLCFGFHLLGWL